MQFMPRNFLFFNITKCEIAHGMCALAQSLHMDQRDENTARLRQSNFSFTQDLSMCICHYLLGKKGKDRRTCLSSV